jgi:hypothetical protein
MVTFRGMSEKNDRAIIYSLETGRGRRVGVLVGALIAVALVVWIVMRGFHGHAVDNGARALTQPPQTQTQPAR